jgi:hypothetical protein
MYIYIYTHKHIHTHIYLFVLDNPMRQALHSFMDSRILVSLKLGCIWHLTMSYKVQWLFQPLQIWRVEYFRHKAIRVGWEPVGAQTSETQINPFHLGGASLPLVLHVEVFSACWSSLFVGMFHEYVCFSPPLCPQQHKGSGTKRQPNSWLLGD